ncbi:MAG: bifunctional metallophosphatase/5'-nucleotidase [Armatimonadota bacterium]
MWHRKGIFVLAAAAAAALASLAVSAAQASKARSVSLVYFADLHAQLEPHPELFWHDGREEIASAGGVSRIAAAVEEIRRERPGQVLFMDAGDTIQGAGPAAWTEGKAVVSPLNALGLDLGVPGNWEVVYGTPALRARARELKHPLVAANVYDAATGARLFAPYLMREVNGVRIAVIGYTDPDVPLRQPPTYSAGLRYTGAEELPPLIREVRAEQQADLVVLLTHIGLAKAVRLAEKVPGVDVLLSSDTHERTYEPIVRGNTWIVEPGSFGSFLGRLDVTVRDGEVVNRQWELIELRADRFPEEPRVQRLVEQALRPHRERLDRVVGETRAPLLRYAVAETALDAVLADALREAAGTEIALSNGFRFAAPIPAGPIREADLWNAYPVVTRVKTAEVTGKQLREFWEKELENVFSADPEKLFGGWLPRPSGMTLRFRARAPFGQRVREIRVHGKPLEEDRLYTVAACEREGDTEDMLCRIKGCHLPQVLSFDAHEAVRRYLTRHSPLAAPAPRRVVAEDLPPVLRSQVLAEAQP